MKGAFILALLASWLAPLCAIYQDQVGEWDWHHQNIGTPKGVLFQGKAMLAWTDEGVLASVNVRTGAVHWRLVLPAGDAINDVVVSSASELLLLTKGGQSLKWVALETGILLADVSFANEDAGAGQLLSLGQDKVAVVAGQTVGIASAVKRHVAWKWVAEATEQKPKFTAVDKNDDGTLVVAGCLAAADDTKTCSAIVSAVVDIASGKGVLKPVSATGAFDSESIAVRGNKVVFGHVQHGKVVSFDIQSGETSTAQGSGSVAALQLLSSKTVAKMCTDEGCSLFSVDGTAMNTLMNCGSTCSDVTFTKSPKPHGAIAVGFLRNGQSVQLHIVNESGEVVRREVPVPASQEQKPANVFVQQFSTSAGQTSFRALVVSAGGTWSMFQSESLLWNRYESLSSIYQVVFVDSVAGEQLEMMQLEAATHQIPGFFERLLLQRLHVRQMVLQTGATFVNLLAKVMPNLPESLTSLVTSAHENQAVAFGFNKLAVCLTSSGALVALDLTTGNVEWSVEHGILLSAKGNIRMLATRPAATLGYLPEVTLISQQGDVVTATVVDALNGNILSTDVIHKAKGVKLLNIFPAQVLDDNKREVFMFLFSDETVVTFPQATVHHEHPVFVHKLDREQGELQCLKVENGKGSAQQLQLVASAVFAPSSEKIVNVVYPRHEDISQSNAQILGDDGVLLKYINPHIVAVFSTAGNGQDDSTLYTTIVDTVACRVLHRTVHQSATGPVKGLFIENWLIYSFFNAKAKRTELGVVTLYEGMLGTYDLNPFKSVQSEPLFSAFTNPAPIGLQKTFAVGRAISSLTASTTAFGITTKHVFLGFESGQVMSIPLKVIDPRRPVGEPNKVEKAEGLMQYSPFLPIMPAAVINYYRAVERLRDVFSTPAKLESTSLVLATGLDLYFTRVMPSKSFDVLASDFNRPLLAVILVGLTVILLVLRKLQHDKRINTSWK